MSLFRQFMSYLFPRPDLADSLPLLPRDFLDPNEKNIDAPDTLYIRVMASVRTSRAAQHIIESLPQKDLRAVARIAARKRRRGSRLIRAWKRFVNLWR